MGEGQERQQLFWSSPGAYTGKRDVSSCAQYGCMGTGGQPGEPQTPLETPSLTMMHQSHSPFPSSHPIISLLRDYKNFLSGLRVLCPSS